MVTASIVPALCKLFAVSCTAFKIDLAIFRYLNQFSGLDCLGQGRRGIPQQLGCQQPECLQLLVADVRPLILCKPIDKERQTGMPIDHQGTRPTSLASTRQGHSLLDYMPPKCVE